MANGAIGEANRSSWISEALDQASTLLELLPAETPDEVRGLGIALIGDLEAASQAERTDKAGRR